MSAHEPNQASTAEERAAPARAGWSGAAFFALSPLGAVSGGMAFPVLTALAALAGAPWPRFAGFLAREWRALALLAALLAYMAASVFWSPAEDAAPQALRATSTVFFGLAFAHMCGAGPSVRQRVRDVGVLAIAAMAALLAIEALGELPLNRMFNDHPNLGVVARNPAKGVSILVILVWGGAAALFASGRAWAAAALCAVAAFLGMQFDQNANAVGFAAGAVGFGLALLTPRFAPPLIALGVSVWALAAPFVARLLVSNAALVEQLPDSWRMRAAIWEFALARIDERPILGWGLDASRTFGEQTTIPADTGPLTVQLFPLHPHSFSLQVWLELGLAGALFLGAALVAGAWRLGAALGGERWASAALCGGFAATFAMWNVSYGAWQEWYLAAPFMAAGLAMALIGARAPQRPATLVFGQT